MPAWMSWVLDELAYIRKFPRVAVGLVILAALGGWYAANFLSRTQISNLQSEVGLLKSQLAAADGPDGPLPTYSLGGLKHPDLQLSKLDNPGHGPTGGARLEPPCGRGGVCGATNAD